jgi:ATP-dependent RNA helicase SUPV3L1/SUV3
VRVDILERLSDLIRPAITYKPGISVGEPPAGTADGEGFIATLGMTSLVGCAGEDFAAILQSLGYKSEKRIGPAITVPLIAAAATTPASITGEAAIEEVAVTAREVSQEAVSEQQAASEEVVMAEAEPVAETVAEPVAENAEAATEPSEPTEPALIEVWFVHRQPREERSRPPQRGRNPAYKARPPQGSDEQPAASDQTGPEGQPRDSHKNRFSRHQSGENTRHKAEHPDKGGFHGKSSYGKSQNRFKDGASRDEGRSSGRPDKDHRSKNHQSKDFQSPPPRRDKPVDPLSPFAKLMALKTQLENKDKS